MPSVSLYVSTPSLHCDNRPIGAEVTATLMAHVRWLIDERISFGANDRQLAAFSELEHDLPDDAAGGWSCVFVFRSTRTSKSFYRAFSEILEGDIKGIHIERLTVNDAILSYVARVTINKRVYYGHILVQMSDAI